MGLLKGDKSQSLVPPDLVGGGDGAIVPGAESTRKEATIRKLTRLLTSLGLVRIFRNQLYPHFVLRTDLKPGLGRPLWGSILEPLAVNFQTSNSLFRKQASSAVS